MGFITLGTYMKLNENINEITGKYSELVALFKEFEGILGEKELAATGLATAIKKLNELIVDWKDIENLDDSSNEVQAQPELDLPSETQPELDLPSETQPELEEEIQERKK